MTRYIPKGAEAREFVRERRFNQQAVERFSNHVTQAIDHSNSRNSRVVQVGCYFGLLSASKGLSKAPISIEGAVRKVFTSHDGFEAAHFLPGQIKIFNRQTGSKDLPWNFIVNPGTRARLEGLFADEEELPSAYNKADSSAEAKGLRETFRMMSEEIFRNTVVNSKVVPRELIRNVYNNIWVPGAAKAFSDAISQKMLASVVPELEKDEQGNIVNLEERGEADWNRLNEADILIRYRESLRTPPVDLWDASMSAIEVAFQP